MGKQYDWLERFIDDCIYNGLPEKCVQWPFSVKKRCNVPQASVNGTCKNIRRIAFEKFYGYSPEYVTLTCGDPTCLNPDHMKAANSRKELFKLTARFRRRKISNEAVMEIVVLLKSGKMTYKNIAGLYGITDSYIHDINHGLKFAHVTGASPDNPISRRQPSINREKLLAAIKTRKEKGLTQKQIGDLFGLHHSTISRIERGER